MVLKLSNPASRFSIIPSANTSGTGKLSRSARDLSFSQVIYPLVRYCMVFPHIYFRGQTLSCILAEVYILRCGSKHKYFNMGKFLRTSGISHKIEDIIVEAKEELVIVSPYLKISNNLFERFKEKSEEGVKINFIYGKSELTQVERNKIEGLKTINPYYYENLHAKCYYNEKEMIITSMNLYEFSEKNNREMGVLVSKFDDAPIFEDGIQEAKSILGCVDN
ncbi:phospholipase D family protein [Pontibacter toksunensis]|uniref:Phospholipase D family protein n=1 Tax=Pontibacter toksunensis TaxID=1332631 RepID=A0ABW6C090_9BACT